MFRLKKKSAAATAAVATSVKLISDTPLAITTGKTPLQQQQQPSLSHPSSSIRYISSKEQEREQEREEEEEEDDMDEIFNIQPGQSERRPVQVYSSSSSQQNNNTIISNASSGVTNHEFEGPPAKRRRIITTATVAPTDTECSESMGVHIVITGLRDGSSSMDLDGDDNYEEEDEMKKEQDRSENAGGGASTDQDENTSPDHQNQLRQLHESSSSASSSNSFQRQVVNNTMTVSADANVGGGVGNKSKGKQKLSDIMVDGALDNAVKTVTAQRTTHCDVLLAPPRKSSLAPRAAKSHHLHPQPPPHRAQQQPTKGIKRKKKTTSLNARVQQQPPSRTVPFSSSRLKQKQKQPAIISLSKEKQQTFALMEALSQLSIDNLELRVIECRLILEAIYNNNSNASSSSSTTTATPFGVLKRVLDQDRGMIQSQSQLNELGSIVGQSLFARLSFKEWMNEDRIAFSVFHLKVYESCFGGVEYIIRSSHLFYIMWLCSDARNVLLRK